MSGSVKYRGLTRVADSYVSRLDQAQKLKEIANRKSYSYKVKVLHEKIAEQYSFWEKKQNPQDGMFVDIKKDLTFIKSQLNELSLNKDRIDILMYKYGCQ